MDIEIVMLILTQIYITVPRSTLYIPQWSTVYLVCDPTTDRSMRSCGIWCCVGSSSSIVLS